MSRGMRLMIMMMVLAAVVTGMMQCAKRTMAHKHAAPQHPQDGMAPLPHPHVARG